MLISIVIIIIHSIHTVCHMGSSQHAPAKVVHFMQLSLFQNQPKSKGREYKSLEIHFLHFFHATLKVNIGCLFRLMHGAVKH